MSDGDDQLEAIAGRQLQERATRLRQTLDEALRELVQPLDLPAGTGSASIGSALRPLRDALQAISAATTQKEVLDALLDATSRCYARSALFVVKRDGLWGWAGRGFDPESADGDRGISGIALPIAGDHLLARAAQSRSLMIAGSEGPGTALTAAFGGVQPREASAMPILLRDRPVALLYGDNGSSHDPTEALWLEIIARIGGLALATLAGEPARRPHAAGQGLPSATPVPPAESITPAVMPTEPDLPPLLTDLEASAGRAMGEGAQPVSGEVRRWQEDARRFASLLVSELLLYNEEAVIQGRRNRDLRQRLRTEIERSRQAYSSRVSPEVAGAASFFDDELVRVLAEGDASLLKP